MYQILCDGYPLLDFRDESLILSSPKVKVEVNTVGEGSFTIYNTHPYFEKLLKKKSVVEVSDEIGVIFRGRITDDTMDFDNGKMVDMEGIMAYFNDSIIRPYTFPDDFLYDEEYLAAAESGNVVEFFLKWLIDQHNSQVQDFQKFKLGTVTVADPNNYISRSDASYPKTWEVLKSKLFESALGGYLCIRYEEDGNYIDYLSEFTLTNTQKIEFGKNLLDLKHKSDSEETCSAIIPIGAEIEVVTESEVETVDETEEETESDTKKVKVTLESLPDGDINEDLVKVGDTLYSKSAVEQYGWIYAPVASTTWPDVTDANNLLTKSIDWLVNKGVLLSDTVEITAVDLHFSDSEIRSFRIYRNIEVETKPHGIEGSMQLTKLDIDILNPQNTKITVGVTKLTLTDQNNKHQSETIERIETAEKDISENRNNVTEAKKQIIEQATSIINTCEDIVLSAINTFTETGDYAEFKKSVEAQFLVMAEEISMRFSETISEIENVNGDLQAKYNTITKYFTFSIDGLIIGQEDNPYKMVLDNDRYSMMVNDIEVLWIDAITKEVHTPELTVTDRFRLMGYLISMDENMNVNCEYIGIPLVIAKQPQSQTVEKGTVVTVSVEATGAKLSYQWQSSIDNSTWSNASGSKNLFYVYTQYTQVTKVYYRCIITDGYGETVTTDVATITVTS